MKTVKTVLFVAAALLASSAFAAGQVTLLAPSASDLAPAAPASPVAIEKSAALPGLERQPVAMSWAQTGDVDLAPRAFVGKSREYFVEVSASELASGVAVFTDSPRALVRVHPVAAADLATRQAIDPSRLELVAPDGRTFAGGTGMELLATAEQLTKAGAPFAPGTSAFRLADELGSGTFKLRAPDLAGGERYQVHVFQPESALELTLTTDRPAYVHGDTLVVEAALADGDATRKLDEIEGFVTSPAGRAFAVRFRRATSGVYRARLALDAAETPAPGLWQAHVAVRGTVAGKTVVRSARIGFGAALPTARLDGTASLAGDEGVAVRLGVETAAAGRYEVRGVLYGTVGGRLVPLAVGHSADWLEAGGGALELGFDAKLLAGAEAPFEVRDLRLLDQGRMGLLHRQAVGLVIE